MTWGCLAVIVGIPALLFLMWIGANQMRPSDHNHIATSGNTKMEAVARHELGYLMNIREVRWVRFDGNNCYVGFRPIPDDVQQVIRAAAIIANRKTGFGYHVWAVDSSKTGKDWQPGQPGYVAEVTARHGKIER